jgi:hypothetical protein
MIFIFLDLTQCQVATQLVRSLRHRKFCLSREIINLDSSTELISSDQVLHAYRNTYSEPRNFCSRS